MFRKITLATFAAVSLSSAAFAQKAIPPMPEKSSKIIKVEPTFDEVEAALKQHAPGMKIAVNNGVTSYIWTQEYNPPGTKELLNWNVEAMFTEKPDQSYALRLWFNCGELAEGYNPDTLLKLMEWNGAGKDSRAFFKLVPSGNAKSIYIVLDVPLADATKENIGLVISHYFDFAHETSHLWGALKTKPVPMKEQPIPSKDEAAVVIADLAGKWHGDVELDGEKVGEWAMTIEKDGFVLVSRVNTKATDPKVQILTGTGSINDKGQLVMELMNIEDKQVYDVKLDGKKLTLSMTAGTRTLEFKLKKM
jgi:hypothetical protein